MIEEIKCTPGSWEALSWEAKNGGTDWNVWGPKGSNHPHDSDLSGEYGNEADARLIAAAPDLYEALNNLVVLHVREQEGISSGMPTSDEWIEAVDIAADALHKACNGSLK